MVNEYLKPLYTLDTNLCKNDLVINNIEIRRFTDFYVAAINGQEARSYQLHDSFIRLHWANPDSSCFYTDTIPAPISSIWNFEDKQAELCEGDSIELIGPVSTFEYSWSTGEKSDSINISNGGDYSLRARLNGCQYTLNYLVSETRSPKAINDTTVCNFDNPLFYEINDTFNVFWSTGENANSISVNDSGHFWFVAKTENCEFSDTFQVIRDCPPQLYIPNAFTPGTDNLNPTFIARGTEIEGYEMRIYAQNGQRVFHTNNLNEGWDGTVRFEPAPIGTYYYVISYTLNGEARVESGNLNLIK
jgi:gliding motility-associated-like protein